LIHGSDSAETAKREIALFFKDEEILDYELSSRAWT
jgi:nucleoside-diphosphate kinase